MKRKKRTRTGARCFRAAALLLLFSAALPAADKRKKEPEPSAVVAGTVFRDSGLALPGAKVSVSPAAEGKPSSKLKKAEGLTDSRGEFAFRVPAGPAKYRITVKAAGFEVQEKDVTVALDESVDVFFLLEPASKK